MSQFPVKASSLTGAIREVLKVRTKGSLAGVNLLMIAIVFPIIMFFGTAMTWPQMGAVVALFITWQGFAVFAIVRLPSHDLPEEKSTAMADVATITPKTYKIKRGKP